MKLKGFTKKLFTKKRKTLSAADQLDAIKNENERQKITIANLERRLTQQVTFSLFFSVPHDFTYIISDTLGKVKVNICFSRYEDYHFRKIIHFRETKRLSMKFKRGFHIFLSQKFAHKCNATFSSR